MKPFINSSRISYNIWVILTASPPPTPPRSPWKPHPSTLYPLFLEIREFNFCCPFTSGWGTIHWSMFKKLMASPSKKTDPPCPRHLSVLSQSGLEDFGSLPSLCWTDLLVCRSCSDNPSGGKFTSTAVLPCPEHLSLLLRNLSAPSSMIYSEPWWGAGIWRLLYSRRGWA